MPPILWTRLFLEARGFTVTRNLLHQDNKSTILLENNGKRSSSPRTRALNIRYFFITDQIEKNLLEVAYCNTDDMVADFMTKPLQGKKFEHFRNIILGKRPILGSTVPCSKECVGRGTGQTARPTVPPHVSSSL